MVKYYFFIGQMNANSGEILRVLKKEKADFANIPANQNGAYVVSEHDCRKARESGFTPIFIGIHQTDGEPNSYHYPYFDLQKSPLATVLRLLHRNANSRQNMIMRYNQGLYFYNRFGVINYLIIDGASRTQIEEIQLFDRQSHEIASQFEEMAEVALNKASTNPLCTSELGSQTVRKDLLVVDLETDIPFGKEYYTEYLTVTDRAFWLQKYQNLVIFDNNVIFYAGFADIAENLRQRFPRMNSSNYGCIDLSWKKDEKTRQDILDYLAEQTINKLDSGNLL